MGEKTPKDGQSVKGRSACRFKWGIQHRAVAMIVAVCMLFGGISPAAYATDYDTGSGWMTGVTGGLCAHHPTHTEECGGLNGKTATPSEANPSATPSNATPSDASATLSETEEMDGDFYIPDITITSDGSYIEENERNEEGGACNFICPICNPELASRIRESGANISLPDSMETVYEGETIDLSDKAKVDRPMAVLLWDTATASNTDKYDDLKIRVYSVASCPEEGSGHRAMSMPEAYDPDTGELKADIDDGSYQVVYVAETETGEIAAAEAISLDVLEGDIPTTTLESRLQGNIFADTVYTVSNYVTADPHLVTFNGEQYEVQVRASKVLDCDGLEPRDSFIADDGATLTPVYNHTFKNPFTITFQPYITLTDGGTVDINGALDVTLYVAANGEVLPELDRDDAFVSSVGFGTTRNDDPHDGITDDTTPFDSAAGSGNDTDEHNLVVRTFDTIVYQTAFKTQLQEDSYNAGYEQGRVYFEYVFPGITESEMEFELGSMNWLTSSVASPAYRIEYINGDTVMRGSFLVMSSTPKMSVIGAAEETRAIVVRVKRMKDGDVIQPSVTYWMDKNDVGAEYDADDPRYLKEGSSLVQKTGHACAEHGITEYSTYQAKPVTVSAVAAYNIQIALGGQGDNQAVGTFDMTDPAGGYSSGFDGKPFGSSVEGRLNGYGVTLQLTHGDNSGKGMRGIEVPEDGSSIEFDIYLSCGYTTTSGKTVLESENTEYRPQIWAAGPCETGSTPGQRPLPDNVYGRIAGAAPFNSGGGFNGCYDGGEWTFTNSASDPQAIHVKVSGFKVDLTQLPSTTASGTENMSTYYDPSMKASYWNIGTACIGAGELWILQPFISTETGKRINVAENANVTTTTHVEHKPMTVTVTDPSGNQKTYTDTVTTNIDDRTTLTESLTNPGTIDGCLAYLRYPHARYNDSLTENCYTSNLDWAVKNQTIDIVRSLGHSNAEGDYMGAAYDLVAKFDDRFMEIDPEYYEAQKPSSWVYYGTNGFKVLYGAYRNTKSGGWHEDDYTGKTSDPDYDDAMRNAMPEDLFWYTSVEELKKAGKEKCCAIMFQYRGIHDRAGNFDTYFRGKILDTAEAGGVYMICNSSYVWTRGSVKEMAKEAFHIATEPTDEQINNFIRMADFFHSWEYLNDQTPDEIRENMPDFYWMEGQNPEKYRDKFFYGTPAYDSEVPGYAKAQYADDGGLVSGGAFSFGGGDSCLLLSYATKVGVSTLPEGRGSALDVDNGMRYADFEVIPDAVSVEGVVDGGEYGGVMRNVEITVQLPEGLTFLPETAYLGGEYIEGDPTSHGTVQGGLPLTDLEGTGYHYYYDEATRTLKIVIDEVQMTKDGRPMEGELPHLYFSALVGTPGVMETDVKDGQSFSVSAEIKSDDDRWRNDPNKEGSRAAAGFTVFKGAGSRLYKVADQLVVESGEPMGFTMSAENRSQDTAMKNKFIIDSLLHNGDGRETSFTGSIYVTEFSAGGVPEKLEQIKNIKFYYTMDPDIRDKDSQGFIDGYNPADETPGVWHELTFTNTPETTDGVTRLIMSGLPDEATQKNTPLTAIAAYGDIPPETTLAMHVLLEVPESQPGERLNNKLSMDAAEAKSAGGFSFVSSREINGTTWLDNNQDGVRQDDEPGLPGVKVTLLRDGAVARYKGADGETRDAVMLSGQGTLDFAAGEIKAATNRDAISEAGYAFSNIPAGNYTVRFESSDSVDLSRYFTTGVKQGDSYKKDSDAEPSYGPDGLLESAEIPDIRMPKAEELSSDVYRDACEDAGFHGVNVTVTKAVEADEATKMGLEDHVFKFELGVPAGEKAPEGVFSYETTEGGKGEISFTEGNTSFTIKDGETITIMGLPAGTPITVKESEKEAAVSGKNRATHYQVDGGAVTDGMEAFLTLPKHEDGVDDNEAAKSEILFTNIYRAPNIVITKRQQVAERPATIDLETAEAGDTVTYTLTIQNTGTEDAKGVVVTDAIPVAGITAPGKDGSSVKESAGLTLVLGSITEKGEENAGVVRWEIETIAPGESKTLSFKVTVPKIRGDAVWDNAGYVSFENDPLAKEHGLTPPLYPSNAVRLTSAATMAQINVTKRIDAAYSPFGDPAFLFTVTNDTTGRTYAREISLSESVLSGSFTIEVPWGYTYTVKELIVPRYKLEEILPRKNITKTDASAGTAAADLTNSQEAEVEYYNVLTWYDKLGHADSVVNEIKE